MQAGVNPRIGSGDRDEALSGFLGNLTMGGLGPRWIRPCPPRYPVHQSEVKIRITPYSTGSENYRTDLNGSTSYSCFGLTLITSMSLFGTIKCVLILAVVQQLETCLLRV